MKASCRHITSRRTLAENIACRFQCDGIRLVSILHGFGGLDIGRVCQDAGPLPGSFQPITLSSALSCWQWNRPCFVYDMYLCVFLDEVVDYLLECLASSENECLYGVDLFYPVQRSY